MELKPIDYKILIYLSKSDKIHLNDIIANFSSKNLKSNSIKYRIEILFDNNYISQDFIEINDRWGSYKATNIYSISELGLKTVEDYLVFKSEKRKDKFWKIFPVIISLMALLLSVLSFAFQFGFFN